MAELRKQMRLHNNHYLPTKTAIANLLGAPAKSTNTKNIYPSSKLALLKGIREKRYDDETERDLDRS